MPSLFNLFWFKPVATAEKPLPAARHDVNTVTESETIDAIILFPALATPLIMVGEDNLELILLTQRVYPDPKMKNRIMEQLKITASLDPRKPAFEGTLFVGDENCDTILNPIEISHVALQKDDQLKTISGKFKGYIDQHPFDFYTQKGFTTVYSVSIHRKCLDAVSNAVKYPNNMAAEKQDRLMSELVFDVRHHKLKKSGRYYGYPVSGGDLDLTREDLENPLEAWHPVYRYDDLGYANIAHASDIHLSARQQIMAQSTARVIDYAAGGGAPACRSIGQMINICSKDIINIFDQFAGSRSDLFVIGGDVVDFMQNCFWSGPLSRKITDGKPSAIWDAMSLDDDHNPKCDAALTESSFTNCIDFIGFYSILMRFCRATRKPVFLVSGNHDCYWDPYGMSPRVLSRKPGDAWYEGSGTGLKRANEGIPADHNLTFYEAILVFGDSYAEIKAPKTKSPPSPFRSDKFDWFYMVFTPFTDYSIELPKQLLVAMGWGNDESLFGTDLSVTGHGFGHLPLATEAISPNQLTLLDAATGQGKKVILLTHFTFVSYKDDLAMNNGENIRGDLYFDTFKKYDEHNFGTFADNRKPIFEGHCYDKHDIQIILTGHSHRRGLYIVDGIDYSGRNSLKIRQFDFDQFNYVKTRYPDQLKRPAIIVSDSSATIPRFNWCGEFSGWGSDQPAGTSVTFDVSGEIDSVAAVRAATCHPRIVVALDYLDIFKGDDVITTFETAKFDVEKEKKGELAGLGFAVVLRPELVKIGLRIESVVLYSNDASWQQVALQATSDPNYPFQIASSGDIQLFQKMTETKERCNFLAMKFSVVSAIDSQRALSRYDFSDPWCWEFQTDFETFGKILFWAPKEKKYFIKRDKARAEVPSFDWRKKASPEKYA